MQRTQGSKKEDNQSIKIDTHIMVPLSGTVHIYHLYQNIRISGNVHISKFAKTIDNHNRQLLVSICTSKLVQMLMSVRQD